MSRIMFLGGSEMQLPPIRYARAKGHYIITVDYKPENPGHDLADEYHNLSTTDLDGVLTLARERGIDGIVAYASDPAAPTAAYVGNRLGLPSNPFETVEVLADKEKFRKFLRDHGFNVPRSATFKTPDKAQAFATSLGGAFFVKPADSSGSKGVTRLSEPQELPAAFSRAKEYSLSDRVVVEEEIPRQGYQIDADAFVVDGELRFCCWSNQHVDRHCNGLVPAGISFPSTLPPERQERARQETQRLLDASGFRTGALNIELVFTDNGDLFFLEVGPRNGGNRIPEVSRYATGVDMIAYTVEAALGKDCSDLVNAPVSGYWASYIMHAQAKGIFKEWWQSDRLRRTIVEKDIWVEPGELIEPFCGSNDTLGTLILNFRSRKEMLEMMDNMENDLLAVTEPADGAAN